MVHYPRPCDSQKPPYLLASLSSPLNCELLENRDFVLLVFVSSKGQLSKAWHRTVNAIIGGVRMHESFSYFLWRPLSEFIYPEANKKLPPPPPAK